MESSSFVGAVHWSASSGEAAAASVAMSVQRRRRWPALRFLKSFVERFMVVLFLLSCADGA
jgi:hypothetical protein